MTPEEVSVAYRRAALCGEMARGPAVAADGQPTAGGLLEVLEAARSAFRSDGLVGINLVAVGALSIKPPDDVPRRL